MSEYTALYRKYRPGVFADVIGQDHITKVLRGEILSGTVSHAYLFCGSRGTGKTTCAKILAKAVNCDSPNSDGDPCGVCEKCKAFNNSFDIVEMDAASNNGVDDIRMLRDKINFVPIEMKRRVYIIDEVHMLSTGAFNALLKTLEEPPSHVMFILATTEFNKIPATIVSRCKRFDFHRITAEDMLPRLRYVCDNENIGINNDSLRLIAHLATGAMRDALSMLELFVGQSDIDTEKASKILGVVGNKTVLEILSHIANKDAQNALECLKNAYDNSKDMSVLCMELGEMFRHLLVMKYASNKVSVLIDAGKDVIDTLRSLEDEFIPERLLYCTEIVQQTQDKLSRNGLSRRSIMEIMIMKLCDSRLCTSPESLLERISALESGNITLPKTKPVVKTKKEDAHTEQNSDTYDVPFIPDMPSVSEPKPVLPEQPSKKSESVSNSPAFQNQMIAFGDVLEEIRQASPILYSMIIDAKAFLDGDVVTLKVSSMGLFMITSDQSLYDLLVNTASKKLGYTVTLKLEMLEENSSDSRKPDLSGF